MSMVHCLQKWVANDQFRRWVEAQIEAADGAPAAHVTVLGGLAEFERQPIQSDAKRFFKAAAKAGATKRVLAQAVLPSKSRLPMSHRKTDLGIPRRSKSAKVVLANEPSDQ